MSELTLAETSEQERAALTLGEAAHLLRRQIDSMTPEERAASGLRARCAELDALMADPEAAMTQAEFMEHRVYTEASKLLLPLLEEVTIEEGEEEPPPTEAERAWDEWYARPITHSLFGRAPVVRVHVPPRLHDRAPRPRRRSSRRRARAPARPEDPELPLDRGRS